MFRKKRVIAALIIIFLCGAVTGVAVAPVAIHKIVGNPYSKKVLSNRVFNAGYLNRLDLSASQRDLTEGLIAEYVDDYRALREDFYKSRNALYEDFMKNLAEILTPAQYERFRLNADREMNERYEFHKKLEKSVSGEKDAVYDKFYKEKEGKKRLERELEYYDSELRRKYGDD